MAPALALVLLETARREWLRREQKEKRVKSGWVGGAQLPRIRDGTTQYDGT